MASQSAARQFTPPINADRKPMRLGVRLRTSAALTLLLSAALVVCACSSQNGSEPLPSNVTLHSLASGLVAHEHLFVANVEPQQSVTMYPLRSNRLLLRVHSSLNTEACLLDDSEGRLYVMDEGGDRIVVFSSDKRSIDYIVSQGIWAPSAMVLDSRGRLYVSNFAGPPRAGSIEIFRRGTNRLIRSIIRGITNPVAMTMDKSGLLFVANSNQSRHSISIYEPNADSPIARITKGIRVPLAISTDSHGNLYVLNTYLSGRSLVNVYAHDSYALVRTIREGLYKSESLALDSSDNLFVGNATNITVYAPGSSKVTRTISTEKRGGATRALLFDNSGALYAAYQGADYGGVKVYPAGGSSPIVTIRHHQGVGQPLALAIGP